jgi:O-antigen/teichoic acid export membrane protein
MTSLLLQVLFPSLNVLLLQSLQGDAVVGVYDAARKWVDAFNIVPSFFSFAVFPVMSRQAAQDRSGLARSYRLSVKLLTLLSIPLSIFIALTAEPLVGLLSGSSFLPQGAEILRLLIWSSLFGWINGLTNYVLIAIHRQRYVLLASASRVVFTVIANVLLVPRYGYMASASIMVGGELLLAALFVLDLRRQLGSLGIFRTLARPALAGLVAGAAGWATAALSPLVAAAVALSIYGAAVVVLRVLTPEERALLSPLVPARLRSALPRRWAGPPVSPS